VLQTVSSRTVLLILSQLPGLLTPSAVLHTFIKPSTGMSPSPPPMNRNSSLGYHW
jgi:hypothetical protein